MGEAAKCAPAFLASPADDKKMFTQKLSFFDKVLKNFKHALIINIPIYYWLKVNKV